MTNRLAEGAAGASAVGGWVLFGVSLAQAIQIAQLLSLIAATACSIAALVYYIRKARSLKQ